MAALIVITTKYSCLKTVVDPLSKIGKALNNPRPINKINLFFSSDDEIACERIIHAGKNTISAYPMRTGSKKSDNTISKGAKAQALAID